MAVIEGYFNSEAQLQQALDDALAVGATVDSAFAIASASFSDFGFALLLIDSGATRTEASGTIDGGGSFSVVGAALDGATKTITDLSYFDNSPVASLHLLGQMAAGGPNPFFIDAIGGTVYSLHYSGVADFDIGGGISAQNLLLGTETFSVSSFSFMSGGVELSYAGHLSVVNGVMTGTITAFTLVDSDVALSVSGVSLPVSVFDLQSASPATMVALIYAGDDSIVGAADPNSIDGMGGNDTILGAEGADTLVGGAGNDVFVIDTGEYAPGESIDGGAGNDAIRFTSTTPGDTLTLGPDVSSVEIIAIASAAGVATGTTPLNLDASALANPLVITGNAGANLLVGGSGADTINGGAGNDTLVGSGGDSLVGGAGNDVFRVTFDASSASIADGAGIDTLEMHGSAAILFVGYGPYENVDASDFHNAFNIDHASSANNLIIGNALDNRIGGDAGNDTLDGGAGNDTLAGGAGNDYLVVDNANDQVTELPTEGTSDTLEIAYGTDFTIGQGILVNVENLVLANAAGVGTGSDGNNLLSSKNGMHTLIGGLGNDSYNVSAEDAIVENAAAGKDFAVVTLAGSDDYTLDDNVENMKIVALDASTSSHGNALGNSIAGSAAADSIDGGEGKDSIAGGAGNDTYYVTLFNPTATTLGLQDTVTELAGGGTDTLVLSSNGLTFNTAPYVVVLPANFEGLNLVDAQFELKLNVTGNALDNLIDGSNGANKLDAGAGNDTVLGENGNDTLLGGAGNDALDGGGGADALDGGTGNDSMAGNAGNDTLLGGAGNDTLGGGIGNDSLDGGAGIDVMQETEGDDVFVVDNQYDVIDVIVDDGIDTVRVGNTYSDYCDLSVFDFLENAIYIGSAYGILTGNSKDNWLQSGAGSDTLIGAGGNDTLVVNSLLDSVSGGDGTDTVISNLAYTLVGKDDIENLTVMGTANKATGNALANVLTGNAAANTLDGGAGADTMIGGAGADTYVVDDAGDRITETIVGALGGIDQVNTSADFTMAGSQIENATVTSAAGHAVIGDDLANKLTGGLGNDSLSGGIGNDTLTGNAGNDRLDGGTGADSMAGGLGNDTYVVDAALDKISELANQGTDTVLSSVTFSLATLAAVENLTLTGADPINATGNALGNVLIGNDGANSIFGGAGNDTLDGGGGADTLAGGLTSDTYVFDPADTIIEDANGGTDTVVSSTIDITALAANVEIARLDGDANLNVTGNSGNNLLIGNEGDNILQGLGGDDLIGGGGGVDTAVFTGNFDEYVIVDNGSSVSMYHNGGNQSDGNDTLTDVEYFSFADVQHLTLAQAIGNTPVGGAGDDTYTGTSGANIIDGGAGNDTLAGLGGNDSLSGDQGADSLSGGDGNDTLDGGAGADTLAGGAASDSYLFDAADTIVEDPGGGTDTVFSSTLSITGLPANVEVAQLDGSANINATGGAGNDLLLGNAGDNVLTGLGGNDQIFGGQGNDTAVYRGNFSEYVITDLQQGTVTVSHTGGNHSDGNDNLNGIEFLDFADHQHVSLANAIAGNPSETPPPPPPPSPTLHAELDGGQHLLGSGTIEITYSFMGSVPQYEIDSGSPHPGFATPNGNLETAITAALQQWSDITNIHFTQVADSVDAQFRFGTELLTLADDTMTPANEEGLPNETTFAYAYLPQSGFANGELWTGDVWINRNGFLYDDSENANFIPGTSVFTTLVHEIGHTLGLRHPFDDGNNSPPYLPAETDNNLYSIMAYNPAPNSAMIDWQDIQTFWYGYGGSVDVRTPMVYDISTIQAIYGTNNSTRAGDTTYGTHVTDGGFAFDVSKPFFMTIWDGGGTDTIDTSNYVLPSIIDLNPGHFSSIGMSDFLGFNNLNDVVDHGVDPLDARTDDGYDYLTANPGAPFGVLPPTFNTELNQENQTWPDPSFVSNFNGQYDGTDNLAIAESAVIENAIGGSGKDQLIGNVWDNQLTGGAGNDTLAGGLGADTLTGGTGSDNFVFDAAVDGFNVDVLADFVHGTDKIVLDRTIFSALALGALPGGDFTTVAISGSINLHYNTTTGDLFYDQDGGGGAAEVKIATLTSHPPLTASDFSVIA